MTPNDGQQGPEAPLERDHPELRTFVAITKKRSARMATLAVLILIISGHQNVDWHLQLALVALAFCAYNGFHLYAKRKHQGGAPR